MFNTKRVNPDLAENLEPLGTKPKYWFREEDTRMLFKAEERGTGEDWAEKVCCELAELLGIPHVHYELAVEERTGKRGVVCPSCAVDPVSLVLGNQILQVIDENYPAMEGRKYKVKEHTVEAVEFAIGILEMPPQNWMANSPKGITNSLAVFMGYVLRNL